MKNLLDNLIEVVGISEMLPVHSKYFKQFQIQEYFEIPCQKPDMEHILRVTVKAEIIETRIIITPEAESHEGQILRGKKLQVRGKLIQKIEYVAEEPTQSVHAAESEVLFSNYIVLDDHIDCDVPITVTPYIEDIYVRQIDERVIFKNIMILINAVSQCLNLDCHREESLIGEGIADRHRKSKHCLHRCEEKRFFTQFVALENIEIPSCKPDIEQLVSTIVDPEILSMKVIDTIKGLSSEGQFLSGKKIVVELKLKQKILYVANLKAQSIHGVENEIYQSVYVVVPEHIEGTETEILLKNKLLYPKVNVEDVYVKKIDNRSIFKNVTLFLEFCYIPTYEICYSSYNNCTSSNLFIMYENGLHNSKITYEEEKKNIKPRWSPDGQHIAYLSDYEGRCMLYIINSRNLSKKQITFNDQFDSIGSYCWSVDGRKIIFSAMKDSCKEIFSVDVNSLKWQQLTNGNNIVKSYKPKCSPEGSKIAYIKSLSEIPYIFVADMDGFNSRQVTSCGSIKDFDWRSDGETIIGIQDTVELGEILFSVNINHMEMKALLECDEIHKKRSVKVSPDNKYVAFIGTKCSKDCVSGIDNIYLYEFKSKSLVNLTNNHGKVSISDFVWRVDSCKIYYADDVLGYYNVFSITLDNLYKRQLTNSSASNMQLSYRPRVK